MLFITHGTVHGSFPSHSSQHFQRAFGSHIPVALYLVVACAITLVAALALKETKGISLHDVDDEDRRRVLAEKGTV